MGVREAVRFYQTTDVPHDHAKRQDSATYREKTYERGLGILATAKVGKRLDEVKALLEEEGKDSILLPPIRQDDGTIEQGIAWNLMATDVQIDGGGETFTLYDYNAIVFVARPATEELVIKGSNTEVISKAEYLGVNQKVLLDHATARAYLSPLQRRDQPHPSLFVES